MDGQIYRQIAPLAALVVTGIGWWMLQERRAKGKTAPRRSQPMHVLCTSPLPTDYAEEFEATGIVVTPLAFDGSIPESCPDDIIFDGLFISPESFKLLQREGPVKGKAMLVALYKYAAQLVMEGRVTWAQICASGLDVPAFFPLMRAAHSMGIDLTHSPGVYGKPIAEYCLTHMLSITRNVIEHADNQRTAHYKPIDQRGLTGATVGIVGGGGIGSEVARLSRAFGCRTIGLRRKPSPEDYETYDKVVTSDNLNMLLAESDFVVLSVPLTKDTRHLIGREQLELMRPTSWLINVSRGPVVDEPALIDVLTTPEKGLAGAVLDVFYKEPLAPDSPLWTMKNCIITPHDSFRTETAVDANNRFFIENARRFVTLAACAVLFVIFIFTRSLPTHNRRQCGEPLQGVVAEEYLKPALASGP